MEKITASDGLFSNRIFKVIRDNRGYMWCVGVNGVARYDGSSIVNFSEYANASSQYIKGGRFLDIIQDKYNNIWVGGHAGIHKFNFKTNSFNLITADSIRNAGSFILVNDSTLLFSGNRKQNYYLNCRSSLCTYSNKKERITSLVHDSLGGVYTSTSKGKVIYNFKDTILSLRSSITDLCLVPNGDLYVGTNNGLLIAPQSELGKKNKSFTQITAHTKIFKLSSNSVISIKYLDNQVWVGSQKGLNRIQLNNAGSISAIEHFYSQPNNPYSLLNNQINDICTDSEGIVWISTYGGINKIDKQHLWFSSFKNDPEDQSSLHDNNIFPISGDALGNIWFGSYRSGMSRLDFANKKFTCFNPYTGFDIRSVYQIYTDRNNETWIAADRKLLWANKTELTEMEIVGKDNRSYSFHIITSIIQHPNGSYWMGLDDKIAELKRVSENKFEVQWVYSEKRMHVICFFVDTYDRLWVGTGGQGLVLIEPDKSRTLYFFNRKNQEAFKTNGMQAINQDSEGNFWCGSVNGLYTVANDSTFQYTPQKIKFKGFFKQDGLTHDYISGILPGKNGLLWLGSWKGIMKFDPRLNGPCRFIPFTFSDGLIDEKYNRRGAFLDKNTDTYYFGSVNGVSYFNPVNEVKTQVLPNVLVDKVILNGDELSLKHDNGIVDSEYVASIEYEKIIDQLQIYFGSSSLLSPDKQFFAWKLEGKDDCFTFTRDRELVLHDILPGEYTLIIKAVSKEGEFGDPIRIFIAVSSNYWYVVVFILCIMFLFALALFFYKRKPIKVEVKEEPKKNENKYVFSKLTVDKSAEAVNRLEQIMLNEKPYLQSDLTADKLAKLVNVSSGELSQIFNEYLNTRFYEYVNKHRVAEFICLLQTSDAEKLTLIALSERCGFTSKSTFYRAFSNEKGMTPAQYAKSLKEKK